MRRTLWCLLATLVLLLGVVSAPLAAQEYGNEIIFAGEPNTTGGTYCFGGDDVKRVNALWHVAGTRWEEALAAPQNEDLREPLHGKPRLSIRDGVVYYAVAQKECFFVPAPIPARVDLFAFVEEKKITQNAISSPKPAPPPSLDFGEKPGLWIIAILVAIWLIGILINSVATKRKNKQEDERRAAEQTEWERTHPAESGPPIIIGGSPQYPSENASKLSPRSS